MTALWTFAQTSLAASWSIFAESSPYLLFGFVAAGVLHGFVTTERVTRHLGSGRFKPVFKAALFGIPLPLCSCGVLPAALGLRQKGAGKGATVSFLISTPETGVDSIALTYALMGPVLAVFRPLAAFVTAVAAGCLEGWLGSEDVPAEAPAPPCDCSDHPRPEEVSLGRRVIQGLRYSFVDLLGDLAGWLVVGFILAGVIDAAVPVGFVEQHLGQGATPLFVMLAVGIPVYICATASTPIAAALLLKGLSPGAALVFLLAGPATNLASLTVLSGTLGPKATARYLVSIAAGALAMGFTLDALVPILSPVLPISSAADLHVFPSWLGVGSALLLIGLAAAPRLVHLGHPPSCCEST